MTEQTIIEEEGKDRIHHYFGGTLEADVHEATGIVIERRGKFWNGFVTYKDKHLDDDWTIVPDTSPVPRKDARKWYQVGGYRVVGIRGLDNVKSYNLRWKTAKLNPSGTVIEGVQFYRKKLWYYNLKPNLFYVEFGGLETAPTSIITNAQGQKVSITPQRIPITLKAIYMGEIGNLYKIANMSPDYYIEKGEQAMAPDVKEWVASKTLDEIYAAKGNDVLWDGVKDKDTFKQTFPQIWGWHVYNLRVMDVVPPEAIQQAGMKAAEEEMKADADIQKTVIKWRKMVAVRVGLTVAEITEKLKNYEEFKNNYGQVADECWKMTILETELGAKARFHIETEGGSGPEGWMAVWQSLGKFFSGAGVSTNNQAGQKGDEKTEKKGKTGKNKKELSSEELRKQSENYLNNIGDAKEEDEEDEE
jgi:hypothetical protein